MLTEIIISHPFLVVRHQCQVRFHAKQLHIFPFTLLPVLQNYVSRQSDIASEPASIISCFVEGLRRWMPFSSGPRLGSITGNIKAGLKSIPIRTSRRLPVWKLIPPVVVLGVGQRIVRLFFGRLASVYFNQGEEQEQMDAEAESRSRLQRHSSPGPAGSTSDFALVNTQRQEVALHSTYTRFYADLSVNLWSSLAVDVLLYPLETIVIRLCVQGTRTLVDNLDTGVSVLPIVSAFDG
ncbi:unnamed protein product, partial [Dibothriocephalus latus]